MLCVFAITQIFGSHPFKNKKMNNSSAKYLWSNMFVFYPQTIQQFPQ